MRKCDYLIVGAGLAGAVLAERLVSQGRQVLVVEQRDHVGGNCYDCLDAAGILIHQYGPHIFHTNNQQVWDYLSRFTRWLPYQHKVLANADGRILTLPVNLNTLGELCGRSQAQMLGEKLVVEYGPGAKVTILQLRQNADPDLKALAETIYETIYLNYSQKQWGLPPDKLDPQVTARVPIWLDRDNRYFRDKYQGLPEEGYTKLINNLLKHNGITLMLGQDYKEMVAQIEFQTMLYTGPLDYFFDYQFGALPYRSLDFQFKTLHQEQFQQTAVVNYTGREPFTRITEFKHFGGPRNSQTTILTEYPQDFQPPDNVPCYPLPCPESKLICRKYQEAAAQLKNVVFVGRLAEYKYYNMDEVVARALAVEEQM